MALPLEARIERLKRRLNDVQEFDVTAIVRRHPPEVAEFAQLLFETLQKVFEPNEASVESLTTAVSSLTGKSGWVVMGKAEKSEIEKLQDYRDSVARSLERIGRELKTAIHRLEEDLL